MTRLIAVVLSVLCGGAYAQTPSQLEAYLTRSFIFVCRQDKSACIYYVQGVIDGTIVARKRFGTPEVFCPGAISYYEIGSGFLAYLDGLVVTNSPALEQTTLTTLAQYLNSRFPCRR